MTTKPLTERERKREILRTSQATSLLLLPSCFASSSLSSLSSSHHFPRGCPKGPFLTAPTFLLFPSLPSWISFPVPALLPLFSFPLPLPPLPVTVFLFSRLQLWRRKTFSFLPFIRPPLPLPGQKGAAQKRAFNNCSLPLTISYPSSPSPTSCTSRKQGRKGERRRYSRTLLYLCTIPTYVVQKSYEYVYGIKRIAITNIFYVFVTYFRCG